MPGGPPRRAAGDRAPRGPGGRLDPRHLRLRGRGRGRRRCSWPTSAGARPEPVSPPTCGPRSTGCGTPTPGRCASPSSRPEQVTVLAHVGDVPGFGWRRWTPADVTGVEPVDRDRGRRRRRRAGAGQRPRHRGGGPHRRHLRPRRPRRAGPPGRRRRLRRHLQLVPARRRHRGRPPRLRRRWRSLERRPAAGPAGWSIATLPLAGRASRASTAAPRATVDNEVRTGLELRAGERAVRVEVTVDNPSRDHRLRARFPLPPPVDQLAGRVRVRGRRAGAGGRGRADRGPARHLPGPAVRAGRRAHRRARRRAPSTSWSTRRRGPRAGGHAAAGHRHAVADADGHPAPPGRAADPDRGRPAPSGRSPRATP